MKPPHMIALGVIVVCMIVMLFSFSGAIAQHVTIRQAMAHPNEVVQVPGNIVKETVGYDAARGELRFDILGVDPGTRKVDPTQRMTIVYAQPKPENFDTAVSVEAIGKYQGGVFRAHNLLVKCPSKYSDDKPGQKMAGGSIDIGPLFFTLAGGGLLVCAIWASGWWVRRGRAALSPAGK